MGCKSSSETKSSSSAAHYNNNNNARGGNEFVESQYLPSQNVEKVQVRNVYDGDTLTLTDGRRVRFLGVDCPELKEKQPFAVEARDYVKKCCEGTTTGRGGGGGGHTIYLEFDPSAGPTQDHYGRLLAYVWVESSSHQSSNNKSSFILVNAGLLLQGLAHWYHPGAKDAPHLHREQQLRGAVRQAIERRSGLWSHCKLTDIVYSTANGHAYHDRTCTHLSHANPKNLRHCCEKDALLDGLNPCRECREYPR